MLNPGDRCPCCGSIIPQNIPAENLALLRMLDIRGKLNRGEISPDECLTAGKEIMRQINLPDT